MKKWPCAGNIPIQSRSWIDKIEYRLYKAGLLGHRAWAKWHKTYLIEMCDNTDLSTDDIEITKLTPPHNN